MPANQVATSEAFPYGYPVEILRIATAGSVDDGKSTLIGRLLYETKCIYQDQLDSVIKDSERLHRRSLDLSFVTDGLRSEREQGITIDVAYRFFQTPRRKYVLLDTPGHEQFTRNMACGASQADLAIVLVDARQGCLIQTRRHLLLLSLLGVQSIVLAVNKMDLVGYSERAFLSILESLRSFIEKLTIAQIEFIPINALDGDNVVEKSAKMPWHKGLPLLSYIESVSVSGGRNLVDLRFPVQHVLRPTMDFRGYAGQIASGVMRQGDELLILPSGKTSRIQSIVTYDGELDYAFAPQSITITLKEETDINRGDMLVRPGNIPKVGRELEAMLLWMDQRSLETDKVYLVKHTTNLVRGTVSKIHYRLDPNSLRRENVVALTLNDIGRVAIHLFKPIFCDEYRRNRKTGCFILIDPESYATVAAGLVIERGRIKASSWQRDTTSAKSLHIFRQNSLITPQDREKLLRQRPVTLWLTGLSGSGKSTIAYELERKLLQAGHFCCVLDADHVRQGLNRDLGFSPDERGENIRRIAELANLLNDAGMIVVVSVISPYIEDRRQAREIIGQARFLEVFVDTPLETCEKRDSKGLYGKARAGLIPDFTGITAPYESPEKPDIHIKTEEHHQHEAMDTLYLHLIQMGFLHPVPAGSSPS